MTTPATAASTVSCPVCGAPNRIRQGRRRRALRAVCSRCGAALPPTTPLAVTDATFEQHVLASPVPILLNVWAPWCVPCRGMTAVLDEIATTLAGRVGVASLNLDQNPIATARLGILGIPTLILFRDGREVDRMIGARGKEDILLKLAAVNGRAP